MANALTAVRLALALPIAVALARPSLLAPGVVALLVGLAIVTDFLDGPVARRRGTAAASGMLFDHSTDCLFVTSGLTGAAIAGSITPILPALIPFAFGQMRRRFLRVASPAAAARQLSRAVERHPLLRADRARRRFAITAPDWLPVAPAVGGGCARVPARSVDRRVHARSCDDGVQTTRPDEFLDLGVPDNSVCIGSVELADGDDVGSGRHDVRADFAAGTRR